MHDTTGTYLASDAMNTPTENITHTTKHVRFAEFFCGIGLIREAVEPLGWECVFANDINTNKTIIYEQRFGREHLTVDDIYNLTTEHIPTEVDAMTASFPCVDLSLAGNRAGLAGTQSGTIWPFMDLLTEQCQHRTPPSYLLLENVVGFLTSKGGQDLKAVCERVASLGYKIDILLVDADGSSRKADPGFLWQGYNQNTYQQVHQKRTSCNHLKCGHSEYVHSNPPIRVCHLWIYRSLHHQTAPV